jgi:hypothetical protein
LKLTDFESDTKTTTSISTLNFSTTNDKSDTLEVDEVILFTYLVLLKECVTRFQSTEKNNISLEKGYPVKILFEGFLQSSTVLFVRHIYTARDLCFELAAKLNIPLQEQKNYKLCLGGYY